MTRLCIQCTTTDKYTFWAQKSDHARFPLTNTASPYRVVADPEQFIDDPFQCLPPSFHLKFFLNFNASQTSKKGENLPLTGIQLAMRDLPLQPICLMKDTDTRASQSTYIPGSRRLSSAPVLCFVHSECHNPGTIFCLLSVQKEERQPA